MGNELKKLFLKWFTEGYYVDEDKVKIRLKNYMIPGRSTVRYTDINIKNIFPSISCEVLPCQDGTEIIRLEPLKYMNYENSLMIFKNDEIKSEFLVVQNEWKKFEYLTIQERTEKIYKISLTEKRKVGHKFNDWDYVDTVFTITKKELTNAVLKRYKELLKVVKDLELYIDKSSGSKQHFSQNFKKSGFYFKDVLVSGKIEKFIFSDDACNKIKKLELSKLDHVSCPYRFQEKIAKVLGVEINKDNIKTTIDNGWGSYTYTFIMYTIDWYKLNEEERNIIKYAYNRFKNICLLPKERYLKINGGLLGLVQSNGYTYVSG